MTVAVARGQAFTFEYAEQAEVLSAAGATVVGFDPLTDPALPEGTDLLLIGGGFPEEHVPALADNRRLLDAVRDFGGVVYAECAGLLYLARTLDGVPMAGRLPTDAAMTPRLSLGYRDAVGSGGPLAGGTSVTVIGTNFTGATAVKFGASNATGVTVNSATSITATSPAGLKEALAAFWFKVTHMLH